MTTPLNCLGLPDPCLIDPLNCPAITVTGAVTLTPEQRAQLRYVRETSCLSRGEMGERLGRSRSWVKHIESGEIAAMDPRLMSAWVDACETWRAA